MTALNHEMKAPYLYSRYLPTRIALLVFKSINKAMPYADAHVVKQGNLTQLFAIVNGSEDEAFIERHIQVAQRIYGN